MADQEEKVEEKVEEQVDETAEQEDAGAEAGEEPAAAEAAGADSAEQAEAAVEETAEETAEPAAAEAAEPAAEPAAQAEEATEPAAEPAAQAEEATEPAGEAPDAAAEEAAPQEELTFEVLHKKTVAELRDIAQGIEHDALHGYSTMHKEHLVPALCTALGIEAHAHHEVVGINKDRVKGKIRELKVERQKALEAGDHAQLKLVRKRIKSLKRKIRRATV